MFYESVKNKRRLYKTLPTGGGGGGTGPNPKQTQPNHLTSSRYRKKKTCKKGKKQKASKKTHDTSWATLPPVPYGIQWTATAPLSVHLSQNSNTAQWLHALTRCICQYKALSQVKIYVLCNQQSPDYKHALTLRQYFYSPLKNIPISSLASITWL